MTKPESKWAIVGSLITSIRRAVSVVCESRKAAGDEDAATCDRWAGQTGDPTITDTLSDPIVQAAMAADGVNPDVLEADLRAMGRLIVRNRRVDDKALDHAAPACRYERRTLMAEFAEWPEGRSNVVLLKTLSAVGKILER